VGLVAARLIIFNQVGSNHIDIALNINGLCRFNLRKPFLFAYNLYTFGFIGQGMPTVWLHCQPVFHQCFPSLYSLPKDENGGCWF